MTATVTHTGGSQAAVTEIGFRANQRIARTQNMLNSSYLGIGPIIHARKNVPAPHSRSVI